VNDNRLKSVFSKEGEIQTDKQIGAYIKWLMEDAKEDWEDVKLGYFLQPQKGRNITKSEAVDGEYPVVAGGLEPSCYHNKSNTKAPVITVSASGANAGFIRLYNSPVWSSDSSFIDETITPYLYTFYVLLKLNQDSI
jgi:type I restriction enzyme S subunit